MYFYKPSTVPVASNSPPLSHDSLLVLSACCLSLVSVYIETISLQLVVDREVAINPHIPPHHRPHGDHMVMSHGLIGTVG